MSVSQHVARVQSVFFGLGYREICDVIVRANAVVKQLNSQSPQGKAIIELQQVAQDLADYADIIRAHESKITPLIEESVAKHEEKLRARTPRPARRPAPAPDKRR